MAQVVRDMDGQFGSGVYYNPGEAEASASCRPSRARMGKLTPAPSSSASHLLAKLSTSWKVQSPGLEAVVSGSSFP